MVYVLSLARLVMFEVVSTSSSAATATKDAATTTTKMRGGRKREKTGMAECMRIQAEPNKDTLTSIELPAKPAPAR